MVGYLYVSSKETPASTVRLRPRRPLLRRQGGEGEG